MVDFASFKSDVSDEVSTILADSFGLSLTTTSSVPHSDDVAITFPNLDAKNQSVKLLETTALYIDMRRSTQLSLRLHSYTVAKLYSAFVRAMTRCAEAFGGEIRGIIGDRVMMLFDSSNCFTNAVDTAVLINSVCQYVLNKHFTHDEVSFGIGIDYGRMLATKTGVRRHGSSTTHDASDSSTNVELRTVNPLLPDTRRSRTQIAESFVTPPLLDTNFQIVDGQHRLSAIAELQRSVKSVPSKRRVDVRRRRKG